MEIERRPATEIPFAETDLVGPDDRPGSSWELTMYDWRVRTTTSIKEWLDEMDGTLIRALHMYPKPGEGLIYATACSPDAPKAHNVSLSADHRQATFSLYTPLLSLNFPRVQEGYKAIFPCRPVQYGDIKVLVIDVKGYRIEQVEGAERQAAAADQAEADRPGGSSEVPAVAESGPDGGRPGESRTGSA